MKAKEAMSHEVRLARPDQTIQEAARIMAEIDAGVIPVTANDRLVGMITDRDIAVRAVAKGMPPSTPVSEIMSNEVKYCFEEDDLEEIAENMADIQVRRLPVLSREKRLVGIISLGDIAVQEERELAGDAICGISERGGQHSQRRQA